MGCPKSRLCDLRSSVSALATGSELPYTSRHSILSNGALTHFIYAVAFLWLTYVTFYAEQLATILMAVGNFSFGDSSMHMAFGCPSAANPP